MSIHEFTLILEGHNLRSINDELEDQLYEAGCNDAIILEDNEVISLQFAREAATLKEAKESAIKQIESLGFSAVVEE